MNYLIQYRENAFDLFNCIIMVHPTIQRLDRAHDDMMNIGNFSVLDVGKGLSKCLLNVPHVDHTQTIRKWFEQQCDMSRPGPVICVHNDLLFLPQLKLNPLVLFQQFARVCRLIALWPGDYQGKILSYSVPGHHHYRIWEVSDPTIKIIRLDD